MFVMSAVIPGRGNAFGGKLPHDGRCRVPPLDCDAAFHLKSPCKIHRCENVMDIVSRD